MRALRAVALTVLVVAAGCSGCSAGGGRAGSPKATGSAANRPGGPQPSVTPTTAPAPPCSTQPDDAGLARCLQSLLTGVWSTRFTEIRHTYRAPELIAPDPARHTGPQGAYLASRAFYDSDTIHLPTGYLAAIHATFGSRSPLVVAFAMAHETGHHVQDLLGVFDRANARTLRSDDGSRRVEMQADCLAGVWAHAEVSAGRMDRDGFATAARGEVRRLSEDTAGGTIDPRVEVRTHGSVAERITWLDRGLDSGDPGRCDTFAGSGATVRLPWATPTRPGASPTGSPTESPTGSPTELVTDRSPTGSRPAY